MKVFRSDAAPAGYVSRTVVRHRQAHADAAADCIAEELPVALAFNDISFAVMMATPCDLEELALGFALTEGIVGSAADVFDVEVTRHPTGIEVQATIAQRAFQALKARRRALAGRTGCGVCGVESLALLELRPPRIAPAPSAAAVGTAALERAARALPMRQRLMDATGGAHAAAWCEADGTVVEVFEDVGRHNALDKLIGRLAARRIDTRQGFVFMSSRASYELVVKAARVGIPLLATISAPTSLAIDVAREAGVRLLWFCRGDGFVEYAGTTIERRS